MGRKNLELVWKLYKYFISIRNIIKYVQYLSTALQCGVCTRAPWRKYNLEHRNLPVVILGETCPTKNILNSINCQPLTITRVDHLSKVSM